MKKVVSLVLAMAFLSSGLAMANEVAVATQIKKLFPEVTKKGGRQHLVYVGQTQGEPFCFLNIANDEDYIDFRAVQKSDMPVKPNAHLPVFEIFSNSKYTGKGKDVEIKPTSNGFQAMKKDTRLGNETRVDRIQVALSSSKLAAVRMMTTVDNSLVPSVGYKTARSCQDLKLLSFLDDQQGQAFAEAAAKKWNTSNPRKRQTGDVMFLGCDGLTPNSITCVADGSGEGDGDEPWLEWQGVIAPNGKLALGAVRYHYPN